MKCDWDWRWEVGFVRLQLGAWSLELLFWADKRGGGGRMMRMARELRSEFGV